MRRRRRPGARRRQRGGPRRGPGVARGVQPAPGRNARHGAVRGQAKHPAAEIVAAARHDPGHLGHRAAHRRVPGRVVLLPDEVLHIQRVRIERDAPTGGAISGHTHVVEVAVHQQDRLRLRPTPNHLATTRRMRLAEPARPEPTNNHGPPGSPTANTFKETIPAAPPRRLPARRSRPPCRQARYSPRSLQDSEPQADRGERRTLPARQALYRDSTGEATKMEL